MRTALQVKQVVAIAVPTFLGGYVREALGWSYIAMAGLVLSFVALIFIKEILNLIKYSSRQT